MFRTLSPTMLSLVPVVSLSNCNRHLVSRQSPCVHVLRTLSPTNAVIIACGEPKQWQQAHGLLAESRNVHVLRTFSHTTLQIKACGESEGTWSLGKVAKRTCAQDVITYNAVISACGKPAQGQQVLGLLTESQSVLVLRTVSPTMLSSVPLVNLSNCDRHLVSWQSPCVHVLQ